MSDHEQRAKGLYSIMMFSEDRLLAFHKLNLKRAYFSHHRNGDQYSDHFLHLINSDIDPLLDST